MLNTWNINTKNIYNTSRRRTALCGSLRASCSIGANIITSRSEFMLFHISQLNRMLGYGLVQHGNVSFQATPSLTQSNIDYVFYVERRQAGYSIIVHNKIPFLSQRSYQRGCIRLYFQILQENVPISCCYIFVNR